MKAQRLTIVTYHYVRELAAGRYPRIRGLETRLFIEQLEYVLYHYTPVSMDEVMDALEDRGCLPERPILLTFDDGYADHYQNCFPLLLAKGVPGAFFPPVEAVRDRKMLGVNKIHFLLAMIDDPSVLVGEVLAFVKQHRARLGLAAEAEYLAQHMVQGRYDPAEVVFVKRMLQRELPAIARAELLDILFVRYLDVSEAVLASELYMTPAQLAHMARVGMYVGSHGTTHEWLNTLEPQKQAMEIEISLAFLRSLGVETSRWAMCYPYGAVDDSLVEILRARGCRLGLTTRPDVAVLDRVECYRLPRLDTNDLPVDRAAAANQWYLRA